MDEHPVDLPSSRLKEALYCSLLLPNYMQKSAQNYERRLHNNLDLVLNNPSLQTLYEEICRKLHSKRKINKMNLLFCERFLSVTSADLFLHGATDHLLFCLTSHDIVDGKEKEAFQILLEQNNL